MRLTIYVQNLGSMCQNCFSIMIFLWRKLKLQNFLTQFITKLIIFCNDIVRISKMLQEHLSLTTYGLLTLVRIQPD